MEKSRGRLERWDERENLGRLPMPRYLLRTLVILTAVVPPLLAGAWWAALLVPRPRNYAAAFICFLIICFNTIFLASYVVAQWKAYRRSRQQSEP